MAQNSTAAMRVLAVPLLVAGLLLALVLVQGGRSTYSIEEITKKVLPAVVAASGMPHGGSAPAEVKSAADGKEGQQQLQAEEKIQVMKCAKQITGDDTPRKLEPDVREKVLKCARLYMPPVHTKELLRASAEKLMDSATSEAEKADARNLVKSAADEDEGAEKKDKTAKAEKLGAQTGGDAKPKESSQGAEIKSGKNA